LDQYKTTLSAQREADVSTTNDVVQEQQTLNELSLKQAVDALADERRRCREELEDQKTELARTMARMHKVQDDHDIAMCKQRKLLDEARDKIHELERQVVAERDRRVKDVSAVNRELLESERGFHKEEMSMLHEQNDLIAKMIQLERKLAENTTTHMQRTFEIEQEAQEKYQGMKRGLDEAMLAVKSQSKNDMAALRRAHEVHVAKLKQEITDVECNISANKSQLCAVTTGTTDPHGSSDVCTIS
jgi:hypothetical protein